MRELQALDSAAKRKDNRLLVVPLEIPVTELTQPLTKPIHLIPSTNDGFFYAILTYQRYEAGETFKDSWGLEHVSLACIPFWDMKVAKAALYSKSREALKANLFINPDFINRGTRQKLGQLKKVKVTKAST